MLIDHYLPAYNFREYHKVGIDHIDPYMYEAMLRADISRSFTIRTLFWLRGIKVQVASIQDMTKLGFILLDEKQDEEIVYGVISTSPTFSQCRLQFSPEQFKQDRHPGHIKAVINFKINSDAEQSFISTETRVLCGSAYIKRKFSLYWFFVEPFSKLIRKKMLDQIKKQVEKRSGVEEAL
jgi:hypothetical protein